MEKIKRLSASVSACFNGKTNDIEKVILTKTADAPRFLWHVFPRILIECVAQYRVLNI